MKTAPLIAWSPASAGAVSTRRTRLVLELALAAALSFGLSIVVGELDHALRTSGGDAPSATSGLRD